MIARAGASAFTGWTVAVDAGAEVAERPVWDEAEEALVWVDIPTGSLHRFRPGRGDVVIARMQDTLGAAGLRRGGGYVLAAGDRFRMVDADGREDAEPRLPPGMPDDVRFNDGACDPAGRFWAGTAASDGLPAGALYRLDPDGAVALVFDGVTESNGLGWSPDARTFYYVDSGEARPRVRAFGFDPDTAALGSPRDLVTFGLLDGIPDGLVVDADGCLWIAMWGGGEVRRYAPDGEQLTALAFPVLQPSCPGFGGTDLADLYVTSAWEGLDPVQHAVEPQAGHVFVTRLGTRGLPAPRYGG